VIGRIEKGALLLDLRCLDDESGLRMGLGGITEIGSGSG
jgi:hypothetical protein